MWVPVLQFDEGEREDEVQRQFLISDGKEFVLFSTFFFLKKRKKLILINTKNENENK